VIALNIVGWPVIQLGVAWLFTRMPVEWFTPPPARAWEGKGQVYEAWFAIKHWKDRLPDGARWFGGGFAKGALAKTDPDYLRQFVRETWRGELCHWSALGFAPIFFLWNPWWADLIMLAYALGANMPCIFAQRYNRIRLQRLLDRKAAHASQTAQR
jgi:glycosyl-4,4'-diaponeurosporenoate acyltransferase